MKLALAFVLAAGSVSAFAPSMTMSSRAVGTFSADSVALFAEPEDEEEGGLDLNLEEMFDM